MMSASNSEQRSLLRGPILLGQLFATLLAVGYAFAGIFVAITTIFTVGASSDPRLDDALQHVLFYGGFTALAASGLAVSLVVARCCVLACWARSCRYGGPSGAAQHERIRGLYKDSWLITRVLVSIWLAPTSMLECWERGGSSSSDCCGGEAAAQHQAAAGSTTTTGITNNAFAPSMASACHPDGCCSHADVESDSWGERQGLASYGGGSSMIPQQQQQVASIVAATGGDGSSPGCYVPLPGTPKPPATTAAVTAAESAHESATATLLPASQPQSDSRLGVPAVTAATAGGGATAPATLPPPYSCAAAAASAAPGAALPAVGAAEPLQQAAPRYPASAGPPCKTTAPPPLLLLLKCFGAEAALDLAPVLLHLVAVGVTAGVLTAMGGRLQRDPYY